MSPEDFRNAWGGKDDPLVRFSPEAMNRSHLPAASKSFLQFAGLPSSAAPFVSFGPRPQGLWPISSEYYEIGSDGTGSPIVVTSDGRVLLLDHEFDFRPTYVNRDLPTLAKCLLQFRDVMSEATRHCGPNEIDGDRIVLATGVARFLTMLAATDADAVAPDAFGAIESRSFVSETAS